MARTVSYAETIAIEAFLGYLNKHYSKLINPKDNYLIAAVATWFYQESGGIKNVIGNNPFNIRPGITSFLSNGVRQTKSIGSFLTFASLAQGFEATAYLLIHADKRYGYQLALNALKNGGNQAALDFLAALAMSSWDAAHYGATDWLSAYNPATNHLLRTYTSITGIQLANPHPPKPKPISRHHKMPVLPRDVNPLTVQRNYLDPYRVRDLYRRRHATRSIASALDR